MLVPKNSALDVVEVRRRVIEAAREEVIQHGILGMRVARVAARAECSLTTMYRIFGSRDGVLAEVLMALYEESFDSQYSVVVDRLSGTGPLTIDDVIASVPMPHYPNSREDHSLRSQVMSVAGTNPLLRERLAESVRAKRRMLNAVFEDIDSRLPEGTRLNREFLNIMVFNMQWQFNDLMGDESVTNDEYTALLRRLIVR